MQKTLIILSMAALAGCSGLGAGTVVQVNSYLYEVAATKSHDAFTDLEEARLQVYTDANAFCAKQNRVVETASLARFEADAGRPASATLRFRCVKSDKVEATHSAQN